MRWATVLVVRVLGNGYSELIQSRKSLCRAGFQPTKLPSSKNAGRQDAGATSNIAAPLPREWLQAKSGPAKLGCAPAASRAASDAIVPGASVGAFHRRY